MKKWMEWIPWIKAHQTTIKTILTNDDTGNKTTKRPRLRYEIESSYGKYWGDSVVSAAIEAENVAVYVMAKYIEMTASLAMTQYIFNKGLKIFVDAVYELTVKELN